MHPAVFLDLDNTIINDTGGLADAQAVSLIQGAAPAIASLRGLGYRIVVVANQEGVARGKMTEEDVHALNARVAELVSGTANGAVIDAFYYCPYHPKGNLKQYKKDHKNRKPKPGMLLQAAEEMRLDLAASWMIGDELADIQAGHAAGARTVLLRPDAERLQPIEPAQLQGVTAEPPDSERPSGPDFYAVGLVQAARLIAQQPRVESHEPKPNAEPGRKWDAQKVAQLQVARPKPAEADKPEPAGVGGRAFRPWGAPAAEEDEKPIVAKPFRKRPTREDQPALPDTPAPALPNGQTGIPETIREAVERKADHPAGESAPEAGSDKTLRLILQELRSQRGAAQDFSFLTIIAVALQLVAIVCLLGGLFMGGSSDALFLRWLGAGIMAQLLSISTMMYGR